MRVGSIRHSGMMRYVHRPVNRLLQRLFCFVIDQAPKDLRRDQGIVGVLEDSKPTKRLQRVVAAVLGVTSLFPRL